MVVGEQRDLDLVFPEEYPAEQLAGKPVVFKVTLKELKEKILPDLDDEFAKDVSEFDTLDEYKASIRDRLATARQADADMVFENALIEQIADSMEADVPEVMIEEQLDMALNNWARQVAAYGMDPSTYLQMMGTTPDKFRDTMRESSEKQVRGMLVLDKIAELEGIEVTEDDIEKEYAESAERYGMEVDKIKESITEDNVRGEIKFRLAAKAVTDSAIALDPPDDLELSDASTEEPELEEKVEPVDEKPKKTTAKKTAAKSAKQTDTEKPASEEDASKEQSETSSDTSDTVAKPARKRSAPKKKPVETDGDAD